MTEKETSWVNEKIVGGVRHQLRRRVIQLPDGQKGKNTELWLFVDGQEPRKINQSDWVKI